MFHEEVIFSFKKIAMKHIFGSNVLIFEILDFRNLNNVLACNYILWSINIFQID